MAQRYNNSAKHTNKSFVYAVMQGLCGPATEKSGCAKKWGEGNKAICFVHGFGCDLSTWERQFEGLRDEKGLQLVFVDLPGFGESSKPHVEYTLNFFARAVCAVLDKENVGDVILVGHSLGYVASSTMRNLVQRQWWPQTPIQTKTMVICTQNSGLEPDNYQKMKRLYPRLDYSELATCGHFIHMEKPNQFNIKLIKFVHASP